MFYVPLRPRPQAEQQAQQQHAEIAKEQAAQALAKQEAVRKQQPKRERGNDGPGWSR